MKINFKSLTTQVLIAIVLGIIFGALFPKTGADLKVLSDIFVKMIKMVIAPIIFLTIVVGIAGMGDMKKSAGLAVKHYYTLKSFPLFPWRLGYCLPRFSNQVRV